LAKLVRFCLLLALAGAAIDAACAQEEPKLPASPSVAGQQPVKPPFPEEAVANATAPCVEPAPMVRIEDYNGPFQKVVGTFAQKLERKSVHPPKRYKPGAKLCTLTFKGKFVLFVADSIDPVTFLGAAFNAGLDQAGDSDDSFGQGAAGYGRRFGAEYIDSASSSFFKDFAYPWIFSEDPRYYRLAHGTFRRRFFHAMEHAVVAHRDDGTRMFNFSEWMGTATTVALANTYHPDNERGFGPAAQRLAFGILQDTGFDVLREFWPEISRKLKLPFRAQSAPPNEDGSPNPSTL